MSTVIVIRLDCMCTSYFFLGPLEQCNNYPVYPGNFKFHSHFMRIALCGWITCPPLCRLSLCSSVGGVLTQLAISWWFRSSSGQFINYEFTWCMGVNVRVCELPCKLPIAFLGLVTSKWVTFPMFYYSYAHTDKTVCKWGTIFRPCNTQ